MFLANLPPLWFWVMNPRIQAVKDHREGRENKIYGWNNITRTKKDIFVERVVYAYFTLITLITGYFAFFTDLTCTLKNDMAMSQMAYPTV